MSIAAKLRAFTILMFIVSIAFGYSFWQTSQNLKTQRNVNNVIQTIIKTTFEFSSITNEYLANQSPRIQSQWGNSHASLESIFSKATDTLSFSDDKKSLQKIMDNEAQAEAFIFGLVLKEKSIKRLTSNRKTIQTISQIRVRVQNMLSEASRIDRKSVV